MIFELSRSWRIFEGFWGVRKVLNGKIDGEGLELMNKHGPALVSMNHIKI
jgi:1-acyl-sn-glycerol-3-phosphate acyltransferase